MKKYIKKTNSKNSIKRRKYKGGDCGCNKTRFTGGYGKSIFHSFDELPKDSYILPNRYQNDPNDPSAVVSSTNIHNPIFKGSESSFLGGKRKSVRKYTRRNKNKKVKFSRKMKIYKGGNLLGYPSNAVFSFGTTPGSSELNNLASKTTPVNPAIYVQPTTNMFSNYNTPLV
jgi:hypothetical protein